MTEKEKAVRGLAHDGNDPDMLRDRERARGLCLELNALPPAESARAEEILQSLFGRLGPSSIIIPPFYCDYGYNIEAGDHFFMNFNCVILDVAKVVFGRHVLVGPNCAFYTPVHPFDRERRDAGVEYAFPITIGDSVWLAGNVIVLPGVSIGEGSVIGAGSVVSRDIPAGVLAVGNPCRVVRRITEADRYKYEKTGRST